MYQWQDETLVAIRQVENGKYKVIELPAREITVNLSRRSFLTVEQAERYRDEQYPNPIALFVQDADIQEEIEIRKGYTNGATGNGDTDSPS